MDRVLGALEVITVFSPEEAWSVFLSQSRLSRVVDGGRYKSWLEGVDSSYAKNGGGSYSCDRNSHGN